MGDSASEECAGTGLFTTRQKRGHHDTFTEVFRQLTLLQQQEELCGQGEAGTRPDEHKLAQPVPGSSFLGQNDMEISDKGCYCSGNCATNLDTESAL